MRVLTSAALAALILSSPALASERGGGHRPSPPPGSCGGGCRPPVNANVNVNVNANSSASARSYINARSYSSTMTRGYVGGGTFIHGGGYAGDYGYAGDWGVGGGYVHVDDRDLVTAPASAPFGYVVRGFGRDYRVGGPEVRRDDRYGREGRWRDERRTTASDHYERWERSETYRRETEAAWEQEIAGRESRAYDRGYDHGRSDGRADCDCRGSDPRPESRYDSGHGAPYYGDLPPPDAPPVGPPPRHGYRQEPGERG